MNELLGRLSSVFVEPAPRRVRTMPATAARVAASVALLCPPDEAHALGSALALATARRARAPLGLAALWRPGAAPSSGIGAPSARRARRLVVSLRARDLRAHAAGRVVRVELPEEPLAAAAAFGRASAASDAPWVLVVAGPRAAAVDAVLEEQDVLVLAAEDPEDPIARLAAARLAALGPPVERIRATLPPVSRALALAGFAAHLPVPLPETA